MFNIIFDFDGVIHSYTSRWIDEATVPDPPVPGAIEFIREVMKEYGVVICSTRAKSPVGISAIHDYLIKYGMSEEEVSKIQITNKKVAAILQIDDRSFCFKGNFPSLDYIKNFKPWNKE